MTKPQALKIKIYSDGADRASLLEMNQNPLVSGMTTNPSLMKKAGVKDYKAFSQEILQTITQKPISFEVFADDLNEMKRQAHEIKTWGSNVYVKIPIMNTKGESTLALAKELSEAGVKLNITALFTFEQVLGTCQALRQGAPSIVSVFAGRLADAGHDPIPLMLASSEVCKTLAPRAELLWASTREVYNFKQAQDCGCEIITAPSDLIKKLSSFGRSPYELSLDTVKTFKADSDSAGFSL